MFVSKQTHTHIETHWLPVCNNYEANSSIMFPQTTSTYKDTCDQSSQPLIQWECICDQPVIA